MYRKFAPLIYKREVTVIYNWIMWLQWAIAYSVILLLTCDKCYRNGDIHSMMKFTRLRCARRDINRLYVWSSICKEIVIIIYKNKEHFGPKSIVSMVKVLHVFKILNQSCPIENDFKIRLRIHILYSAILSDLNIIWNQQYMWYIATFYILMLKNHTKNKD